MWLTAGSFNSTLSVGEICEAIMGWLRFWCNIMTNHFHTFSALSPPFSNLSKKNSRPDSNMNWYQYMQWQTSQEFHKEFQHIWGNPDIWSLGFHYRRKTDFYRLYMIVLISSLIPNVNICLSPFVAQWLTGKLSNVPALTQWLLALGAALKRMSR